MEVSLQLVIAFDSSRFHEGLDLWIAVPLLTFVFVTADVHVSIRKQRGHLTQKSVKKFVGLFARRVERRLKDSRAAFNFERAGSTTHLRVTNEPAGAVAGNIKFRHYPNAALARISNNLAHLILRIEQTIGAERVELGELLTFDAKALVLGQMPMKDVQLYRGHRIEIPFEDFHGLVVTADIDQ